MAQLVEPILLDSTGQDIVTALNAIANTTVDTALSPTSANPVQNAVITTAINGKQRTLTWDGDTLVL